MDIRDKLHLVIYRVRERGLEVFVRDEAADALSLPQGNTDFDLAELERLREEIIALDEAGDDGEAAGRGIAIEADYHDIPSLKGLLLDDARALKRRLSAGEEGSFVAVKEVAKRLLPQQYRLLSELRDILVDRNSTKYM